MNRLRPMPTHRIDLDRPLSFTYRGRTMKGLAGDTVAVALLANGVRILSRSLKYHRPRGLYSLDGESSNCLMAIDGIPNVRAEVTLLQEGLKVEPQNVSGSPERDRLGFIDKLDLFLPAGFYYNLFHKPAGLWPFFMKRIRKMAGMGSLDTTKDLVSGRFDELFLNAEVCVLGGGPAGLSAALAAAEQGLRVVLFEARPWLGGFFDWRTRDFEPGLALFQRARNLAQKVAQQPNIRVFSQTFVNNLCGGNLVTAFQVGGPDDYFKERYIEVRAGSVVTALGCIERPLIFENNDRPGVMQVACAHRLAKTYGLLPGRDAIFSVGDDLGLEAALDLAQAGLKIWYVADCRRQGQDPELVEALKAKRIAYLPGWVANRALGKKTVSGVELVSLDGSGQKKFNCQVIVASAGLTPVTGPLSLAQAKMTYDQETNFFLPTELPPGHHAAGRLLGLTDPRA
ncbi:MAG: (2Fe-2S)-binding protein, partial [Deltaproteobacteria bacterium]|nr:(2Fe-2S)-binding protein [Deltaproteobacteria bacterium]